MTVDTIHVVDDEPRVLRSMVRLLRASGLNVEPHASAKDFLSSAPIHDGGCVLLDYEMPGFSGLDLQALLSAGGGIWEVIFISGRADIPLSVRAMKNGAVDFLVKPSPRVVVLAAVERAFERRRRALVERGETSEIANRLESLSPREHQVLGYVIGGLLNKQIADLLGTAEKTVKIQRSHVMRKMGVNSVAELVRLTEKAGVKPLLLKEQA